MTRWIVTGFVACVGVVVWAVYDLNRTLKRAARIGEPENTGDLLDRIAEYERRNGYQWRTTHA